jgi:hypothetical protein
MEEAALRKLISATLGLAFLAAFSLANTANAAAILSFSAGGLGPGTKTATANGTTSTTLNATSPLITGGFPVLVGTFADVTLGPIGSFNARETFGTPIGTAPSGITSVGPATLSDGVIQQGFSGTISYTDPTTPATNYLTVTFVGVLRGSAGGSTVELSASNTVAGQSVTFTSSRPEMQPFINQPFRNFTIGLTGLSTPLAISGVSGAGTIASFSTTNQSGNFSTAVPEPTSVVMAGTAVLAGLGCFGWRRSANRSV